MTRRSSRPTAPRVDRSAANGWRFAVPAAIGWLVLFTVYYFTRELPNNHIDRSTLAFLLPDVSVLTSPEEGLPSGWGYLPQRFDLMAVAAFLAVGAYSLGKLLFRLTGLNRPDASVPPLSRFERAAISFGLGISAWSLLTLLFGVAGWLSRPLFAGVLALSIAGELSLLVRDRRNRPQMPPGCPERPGGWSLTLTLAAIAPFLLAAALGSMLPPFDFDVKEYHLGGPKEWFLNGRVSFLPHNVYTSFPFLTEMLSLSAMVVRGDWYRGALAGQLLLAGFLPLTATAVFLTARRLFGTAAGLLATVIYATIPWSYRIAVIAYAEGGLTCYLALSLLVAVMAIERIRRGERSRRPVLLAGLFTGGAMACKYTGVVQAVIPIGIALLGVAIWHRPATEEDRNRIRSTLAIGTAYALGVVLAVGPWLLKNTLETGNPVYPLLWSVFDGRDWDSELNTKWTAAHSPAHYQPLNFFREIGSVAASNDWQSLLVFAFAPLALLASNRRAASWLWLYIGFLYAAWWLLTHRIDRFWVPLLPVACVAAGAGAGWAKDLPERIGNRDLGQTLRSAWRFVAGAVISIGVLFNLGFITTPLAGNPGYLADLDKVAKVVETPNLALLNRMLPADAKVLLVGEAEIFDARFPLVYNTVFDRSLFEDWIALPQPDLPQDEWPLRPADEIRGRLSAEGITHIYVNWREILRYRTTYGYTPFVTPDKFDALREEAVIGEPIVLRTVPLAALGDAERREALDRFGTLVRGRGDDRTVVAAELYSIE